jgi:hypothetical protein
VHIKANPASHYRHTQSSRNVSTVFKLSGSVKDRMKKEGKKK